MQNKKKYAAGGITVVAAILTAHIMQSNSGPNRNAGIASVGAISAAEAATVAVRPAPLPVRNEVTLVAARTGTDLVPEIGADAGTDADLDRGSDSDVANALPRPPKDKLMPAPLPQVGADLNERMARVESDSGSLLPDIQERAQNQFGLPCGPILSASVKESAMVALTLTAPCRGDQRITVRHGPLAFSARLDQLGNYSVTVPAMMSDAQFTVTMADGTKAEAEAIVPLADDLERVALMYQGDEGLQIHALEFGADYDQNGHVWAGASRTPEEAMKDGGGFMTTLGDFTFDDTLVSEIYTFPGETSQKDGVVRLSVEAEVTAYNCGTQIAGKTAELIPNGGVTTVSLEVEMPDCNAIGEYLVLKNLLRDLKVASN